MVKINKKKKELAKKSGLGCKKPKSPSTLEREESDLRIRNSKPERFLLLTQSSRGAGPPQQ